jgi:hypothetical protein
VRSSRVVRPSSPGPARGRLDATDGLDGASIGVAPG